MNIDHSYVLKESDKVKISLDSIIKAKNQDDDLLSQDYGFLSIGSKEHVVTHPQLEGWVVKGQRRDHAAALTDSDTHIYRVFQRELIQKTIVYYSLTDYVVPKKFIYYHEQTGQALVVAKKLKLIDNPITLTSKQAREGAIICHYGRFQDVSSRNFAYTESGSIALVDTEPVDRKFLLTVKSKGLFLFPWYLRTVSYISSSTNSTRLKRLCKNTEGIKEIDKIERCIFLKEVTVLITEIALPIILLLGMAIYSSHPILFSATTGLMVIAAINGFIGLLSLTLTVDNYVCNRFLINKYIYPGINGLV